MSAEHDLALEALQASLHQVTIAEQSTANALQAAASNVKQSVAEAIDKEIATRCSAAIDEATGTATETMARCWEEVRNAINREITRIRLQKEAADAASRKQST